MTSSRVGEVPLWTGQEPNPGLWDDFRFAFQGYCGERGLSSLIREGVKIEDVGEECGKSKLFRYIARFMNDKEVHHKDNTL